MDGTSRTYRSAVAAFLVAQACAQVMTALILPHAISAAIGGGYVGSINSPSEIGHAIEACWHPPHDGDQVTVRLSFRRNGSVLGRPFVTFSRAMTTDPNGRAKLATSILDAIAECDPLPFTDALGASIAGRVILIRFVATRGAINARL